jgi:hypothetical protein
MLILDCIISLGDWEDRLYRAGATKAAYLMVEFKRRLIDEYPEQFCHLPPEENAQ